MAYIISDNIISPLGITSAENYLAVCAGRSALAEYPAGSRGVQEAFCASLFSREQDEALRVDALTPFESVVAASAQRAMADCGVSDIRRKRTVLILSTTKGNTDLASPADSAVRIGKALGLEEPPIVVCNACISGLAAVILAKRLLETKIYDYAVVCGADRQGKFIISGFQSLKALSPEECRPFDIERLGLNLGEAAATVVMSREKRHEGDWCVVSGAIRNDAYHVSAPSRKGEGLYRSLRQIAADKDLDRLAFVNAHGTATMFNDQMESVALDRMQLNSVPVNALKGYYGHTMGAAGLLELIISAKAAADGKVVGTRGYDEAGVSGKIQLSSHWQATARPDFIKMLSGFGGCNAAVWTSREMEADAVAADVKMTQTHHVVITPESVMVDGRNLDVEASGADILTYIYKVMIGGYAKFYKMDRLSRLGFIASELLLQAEGKPRFEEREDRAVVFCNHSSSVDSDRRYMESIKGEEEYFASPSVFVYTLPNIVTGEIAMRNNYHGETSFYILPQRDDRAVAEIMRTAFSDTATKSVLGGWLDFQNDGDFIADVAIFETF